MEEAKNETKLFTLSMTNIRSMRFDRLVKIRHVDLRRSRGVGGIFLRQRTLERIDDLLVFASILVVRLVAQRLKKIQRRMNADDQGQIQNALRHCGDRRRSVLMNEFLEERRVNILQGRKRLWTENRRGKTSLGAGGFVRRHVDDDGRRFARRMDGRTLRTRTFDLLALLRISSIVNVNDQRTRFAQRLEKPGVVRVVRRRRRANLHVEIVDANVDFRPIDAKTSQRLQKEVRPVDEEDQRRRTNLFDFRQDFRSMRIPIGRAVNRQLHFDDAVFFRTDFQEKCIGPVTS